MKSGEPPSLTRGQNVTAVTSLGDDVFVLRWAVRHILVYDAATFRLQHCIPVPSLSCPWGLAACAHHRCLYVSDSSHSIHRTELAAGNPVTQWSVAREPRGVSVNNERNVVVAFHERNRIQEYTTHGALVREIFLQTDVKPLFHAVQLSSGHYVVSQCTLLGALSVVGLDGQVVRSYCPPETSDVGQIRYPRSLAVTKNDDILVVDRDNERILSVDSSLSSAQELDLSVDDGIHVPWAVCLDASRTRRLYVGEGGGSFRVLVFDGVTFSGVLGGGYTRVYGVYQPPGFF